jgi:RNA 3'-terminal phosphate cyclase (ATP)
MESEGVIDQYFGDQILLPLAFANGISEFRTSCVTQHLITNADIIHLFLPARIDINGDIGKPGYVRVNPNL